jgi:hypothetical protein
MFNFTFVIIWTMTETELYLICQAHSRPSGLAEARESGLSPCRPIRWTYASNSYANNTWLAGWSWLTMHFIASVLLCSGVWSTTE